ncbi:hypothetical protein GCM10008179_34770 [Hansschlegelia plantiphila]|uniref:Uncharacterized protein n=1 Tax=Hansschlegelia plantiphila TaxID=374655 RepID=A0A9W6J5L7_9HYPH|nr:hypothetical protein GCM10008179_34770 [Hansschlegelia plantiphila]
MHDSAALEKDARNDVTKLLPKCQALRLGGESRFCGRDDDIAEPLKIQTIPPKCLEHLTKPAF